MSQEGARRAAEPARSMAASDEAPGREYTCPMHPEVVRDGPGSCPICGMALDPRVVTLKETNPELDDMTGRFRWSTAIIAPILAFMVSEFLPGQPLQRLMPLAAGVLYPAVGLLLSPMIANALRLRRMRL